MSEYRSADNYPVEAGRRFWNNDLRICQVTKLAEYGNPYADTGCTQTWHKTTHGNFDTLDGSMRPYGRLARYFEGRDAEDYEPGTDYASIKGT